MKVLHLAYYHNKNDSRIVQKECNSLIQNGYQVYYATSDCDEEYENAEKLRLIPLKAAINSVLVNYFINKELRQEYIDIIERIHTQIIHIHEYGISYLV